jgi:tetratricopeptide (TPR) repeat protein
MLVFLCYIRNIHSINIPLHSFFFFFSANIILYCIAKGVDPAAYESLRWNYKGNSHLDKGEISSAIQCYDRALDAGYKDQEGVLLVMRATAYLQRAYNHRKELKVAVQALEDSVPDPAALQTLFQIAAQQTSLANAIFTRVCTDFKVQNKKFQQTKFRHGLYEYALLHATQDSLRATQLLPRYAMTWMRAGDSLAELRKLKESVQYYEKALQLDPTLSDTLRPTIARLKASQDVLDNARQDGYSEDALRVALDVLG